MSLARPIFLRAIRNRCPRCGEGKILKSFNTHQESCSACGLTYVTDSVDLGAIMYLSTAAITGLFVVAYLTIGFPTTGWYRLWVGVGGLSLIVGTLPLRRCLAIGLIYLGHCLFDHKD